MERSKTPTKSRCSSKLCVVVTGPTLNEAREQVKKAASRADMLEFRLDQWQFAQIDAIKSLKESTALPVIFTLRKRSQGGGYTRDEEDRLKQLRELAKLSPDYIDLEYDVPKEFYGEIASLSPRSELISSFHDFSGSSIELEPLLAAMKQKRASLYKIATMATSINDSLKMLSFLQRARQRGERLIGVCMGEDGLATRLLGPIYGNSIVYAKLSEGRCGAPGQLTAEELIDRYGFKRINGETAVLGLIGDPVTKSPSHMTHNDVIRKMGLNAVYVKFHLTPHDFVEFASYAKKLKFKGLSVTMPLKELVHSALTEPSLDGERIGAINTLRLEGDGVQGFNTDGKGALDAVEQHLSVAGKRAVILGAGGAGKAVAREASQRGAELVILNRDAGKAEELARQLGAKFGSLADFPAIAKGGYDLLINCTSLGMYRERSKLPVDAEELLEGKVVMDIIPGREKTPLLEEALKRGCRVINGNEMLMLQAVEQFALWFGEKLEREELSRAFRSSFELYT